MTQFSFKLKIYPNPMRSDGVFIAEDKPIEPYDAHGFDEGPRYPATPTTEYRIPTQLDPAFAAEIVRRWNLVEPH